MKKLAQLLKQLNTPTALIIGLSLAFTGVVSAVVGLGGYLLTGTFWGFFALAFGVQFVLFAVINTYLQRKDTLEGAKVINEQLEALSKFTIQLGCAYCKQVNAVPITLNQENRFQCGSCNQVNAVRMQFFAAQITTPLNKVVLPVGDESVEFRTSLS
jgi:Na+/phosphate symporter